MPAHSLTDSLELIHADRSKQGASPPRIPQLGFGVYLSQAALNSCLRALEVGYRHIDTAQFYDNEAEVGQAIRQSPHVSRSDVFITTKIMVPGANLEETYQKCLSSVNKLDDGGYVDLFLIHSAFAFEKEGAVSPTEAANQRRMTWHALERLFNEGKARSIGVSNFTPSHIEELKESASIQLWPPAVNQIELHPWCQQKGCVDYCRKNLIAIEAYCPIARNRKSDDAVVKGIADKIGGGVTPNQVLIRWSLQKGFVPLPKSDDGGRIAANADVYGFELGAEDMAALDGLDQGEKGALVKWVGGS